MKKLKMKIKSRKWVCFTVQHQWLMIDGEESCDARHVTYETNYFFYGI